MSGKYIIRVLVESNVYLYPRSKTVPIAITTHVISGKFSSVGNNRVGHVQVICLPAVAIPDDALAVYTKKCNTSDCSSTILYDILPGRPGMLKRDTV